jgi:hypothetical protein
MRGLGCGDGYSNRERQRRAGMSGAYRRVLDGTVRAQAGGKSGNRVILLTMFQGFLLLCR